MSRRYLATEMMKDIKIYELLMERLGKDSKLEHNLAEKKRNLRAFLREEGEYNELNSRPYNLLESKTVISYDEHDDGYVEKCVFKSNPFSLWGRTEIEELFEELFEMHINSPYDCTGLLFTSWYRVVKLNNRWTVYHCVGFDV